MLFYFPSLHNKSFKLNGRKNSEQNKDKKYKKQTKMNTFKLLYFMFQYPCKTNYHGGMMVTLKDTDYRPFKLNSAL